MNIFFDTEFTSLIQSDRSLISAGFVTEDGKGLFYREISNFSKHKCSPFVERVVIPLLNAPSEQICSLYMFGEHLIEWLNSYDQPTVLISDYIGDWELVWEAIGNIYYLSNHPITYKLCWGNDVAADEHFWTRYEHQGMRHHALHDAMCLREYHFGDLK